MKKNVSPQIPQARENDLVVQEMPEETLVYDLTSHQAHSLNKSAALVWTHSNGQNSIADLTQILKAELNIPVDEDVVWFALDRLGKANLLQEGVRRPAGTATVSRRALVGKMGLSAMLAVPVIMSITSPAAAVAASLPCVTQTACTAQCQPCFPTAGNPMQCNTNTCKQTPTGFNCNSSAC